MPSKNLKDEKIQAVKKKMTEGSSSFVKVSQFVSNLDAILVFKSQDDIEKDFKKMSPECLVTDAIVASIPPAIKEIDENLAVTNADLRSNAAELAAEEQKLSAADSKSTKAVTLNDKMSQAMTIQMARSSIQTLNKAKSVLSDNQKLYSNIRKDYSEWLSLSTVSIRARLTAFKAKTSVPSNRYLGVHIKDLIAALNEKFTQYNDSVSRMENFATALEQALKPKENDSKVDHAGLEKTYNELAKDRERLAEAYPGLKNDYDVLAKHIDVELELLQKVVSSLGNSKGGQQSKMFETAKSMMKMHKEAREIFGLKIKDIDKMITLNFKLLLEKLKPKSQAAALAASLSKVTGGAQQTAGAAAAANSAPANPNANQAQFKPA